MRKGQFQKGHQIRLGIKHSAETRKKMSLSQKARSPRKPYKKWSAEGKKNASIARTEFYKKNPPILQKKPTYRAIHMWVQLKLGKPAMCSICKRTNLPNRRYHWANISGKYKRDLTDWLRLCTKCHGSYDWIIREIKKIIKVKQNA